MALKIYGPENEADTNLYCLEGENLSTPKCLIYSHIEAAGDQFTAHQKRTIVVDIVCNLR